MNPQVEPMPAEGDFLARLGCLEWPRWAVAVFPPIFVAAFGFACVILTNQTILPTALAFAAAGGLGLVAGFAARRALRRRADLTRALVALAGLTIGLLLLGILTWGGAGVGPFGLESPGPNWTGLAQLLLAFGSAWLALRAWRPAAPPARSREQTPPTVPAEAAPEAQAPTPRGETPRRVIGAARDRAWAGWRWLQGQTNRASRWPARELPARMRARRTSEGALNGAAGRELAVSNRDVRGPAAGRAYHAPAASRGGAGEQNMLQHLARPLQAARERVTAAWQSRFRGGNGAGGRGRVHLPGSTPAPLVNLRRKARVRFTGAAADYCPFCLELVVPDDPRGVVVCPVCRTRHHADCWAVTGMCQVPHQHS